MREGRRCTGSLKETSDCRTPLALLETKAAQLSPSPLVQTLEFEPACREAVAGKPSNGKQVEFDDRLRETDAPVSTGNLPDLLLRAVHAPGRDSGFAVPQQPVAGKLALPDRSDGALFVVHPKLEFLFQKPGYRFHHALAGRQ